MKNKPNVLWITMDELHRNTLSCYGAESHCTRNIDRIAAEGLRFDNAYAGSPVCLPSRVSLATGLYPHHSRSISNHTGASFSMELPSVFRSFKASKYSTSLHGKCHFIPVPYPYVSKKFTREYDVFHHYYRGLGIDHLDLQDGNEVSAWFYDDYAKEMQEAGLLDKYRELVHNCNGERSDKNLFLFPGPEAMHPDSWVARKATEHLQRLDCEQPHFMWVSFSGPHYPLNTPEQYLSRVDMSRDRPAVKREGEWEDTSKSNCRSYYGPGGTEGSGAAEGGAQMNFDENYWHRWRQMYFANIVQIDDCIGRILQAAEDKWGDDFITVFTCDHGDMMGNHGIWGKNGAFFEDIIKVPLFIRQAGQKQGGRCSEMVSLVDVFPTSVAMAGLPEVQCDGQDLRLLADEGGRAFILSETENLLSIVKGSDKLTYHRRGNDLFMEQYYLASDPFEFDNIYTDEKGKTAREDLEAILLEMERDERVQSLLFYDTEQGGKPPWLR